VIGLYLTSPTQHSQEKDTHAPGGIRTRNLSKRANADARLRPRGYRDEQSSLSGSHEMHTQAYRKWANYWSLIATKGGIERYNYAMIKALMA